jgi:hypothetical protein
MTQNVGTLARWSPRESSKEGTWGTASSALCSGRGSESLTQPWGRGGMGSSTVGVSGRDGGLIQGGRGSGRPVWD